MPTSRALGGALICLVAACSSAPTAPSAVDRAALQPADPSMAIAAPAPRFNPQPDPPKIMQFHSYDLVAGSARGSFASCKGQGTIVVTRVATRVVGDAAELTQTWRFVPPDPCTGAMTVALRGTLDQRAGTLRLEGVASDGTRVVVTARTSVASFGPGSVAGEVAFNPQPDPPLVRPGG